MVIIPIIIIYIPRPTENSRELIWNRKRHKSVGILWRSHYYCGETLEGCQVGDHGRLAKHKNQKLYLVLSLLSHLGDILMCEADLGKISESAPPSASNAGLKGKLCGRGRFVLEIRCCHYLTMGIMMSLRTHALWEAGKSGITGTFDGGFSD